MDSRAAKGRSAFSRVLFAIARCGSRDGTRRCERPRGHPGVHLHHMGMRFEEWQWTNR